jgi:hypothetical protein
LEPFVKRNCKTSSIHRDTQYDGFGAKNNVVKWAPLGLSGEFLSWEIPTVIVCICEVT